MEATWTCYWLDRLIERGRKGGQTQRHPASTSEIKASQQFNPQVNTKVDEMIVNCCVWKLIQWPKDSWYQIPFPLLPSPNWWFLSPQQCEEHSPLQHTVSLLSITIPNVPEALQQLENHSTATCILLVRNWEMLGKIHDFQRFPWEWVMNIHGTRDMKCMIPLETLEILSSDSHLVYMLGVTLQKTFWILSCEKDHRVWPSFSSISL